MVQRRVHRRGNRVQGFALLEAVIAIVILSAFSMIAIEVASVTLRLPAQAAERENRLIAEATAMERLRTEVWSAEKIDVEMDGRSVRLTSPSGTVTGWHISPKGGLTAVDPAAEGEGLESALRSNPTSTTLWKSFARNPSGVELRGDRRTCDFGARVVILRAAIHIESTEDSR